MTAEELRNIYTVATRNSRIENYDYAKARARLELRNWVWSNFPAIILGLEDRERLDARCIQIGGVGHYDIDVRAAIDRARLEAR